MRTIKGSVLMSMVFWGTIATLAACKDKDAPLSHDEIIRADLAEILELQGVSCGEIETFEVRNRLDFRIECGSGDQYRIHVSAEGHIKVNHQQD